MPEKFLVVVGDGMADEPLRELGGKTPLEYARTPNMDRIAREGMTGLLRTVPPGFEPGSDIANLSVLGYDPKVTYTGRGPLEAVSMGICLGDTDVAYRCNLVTVKDGIMVDFSAGHISSAESASLLGSLQEQIPEVMVRSGVSYRNLLVLRGGLGSETVPPHDIVGREIQDYLPKGRDAPELNRCVETSRRVFAGHPINSSRRNAGLPEATQIWPWSGGKKPSLQSFYSKFRKHGGVISAVDLLKGIARCAELEVIEVPGATGYLDTDYGAKADYALSALRRLDFLYLHVEAPDEAGHMGNLGEKVKAIERVDEMIGRIMNDFSGVIAVLPDHPTPLRLKTHTGNPVPVAVLGRGRDGSTSFSERQALSGGMGEINAVDLLPFLFTRN